MNVSKILATIFLLLAAVIVESRVRPPQRRIQHPQVLTRPPAPASTAAPAPANANAKAKITTTTTTTPEPPEAPDAENAPTGTGSNNASPFYYDYDPFYGIDPFSSLVYGGGLFGGGLSMEADDDVATTTRRPRGRGYRGRQNPRPVAQRYVAVTAKPAPAKPTTPEPDDDLIGNGSSGSAHTSGTGSNIASSGGYCFCSPLKACPAGSIPRGGYCWNFVSYFTDILYRRCCYSPSMAKYLNYN